MATNDLGIPNDLSAFGPARSTVQGAPLSTEEAKTTDAYWRACNYLALGMIYLQRQPPAEGAAEARAHQEPPARPLGFEPRPRLHLHPPEPADQEVRPGHDLHGRPRTRRARRARPGAISKAPTPRSTPKRAKTKKACASSSSSSLSRAASAATARRNARLDPRRRRTRLRPVARLRRGVRQSRPDRRRRGRRRRIRDRPAGHLLAHQQIPEPDPRRRGAADPSSQRLQDQQSDAAGAHPPRGTGETCCAATAGRRISSKAPTPTPCTRRWPPPSNIASHEIRAHPAGGPRERRASTARAGR